MMPENETSVLPESALPRHLLHTTTGSIDAALPLRVALLLMPRCGDDAFFARTYALGKQPLATREPMSSRALEAAMLPSQQALDAVKLFCAEHALTLERTALGGLFVTAAGTAGDLARAFGVDLRAYIDEGRAFRGYEGRLKLPATLAPHVRAVLGLDDSDPIAEPAHWTGTDIGVVTQANNLPTTVAFDYYQYPSQWTGKGATVAFIESNLDIDVEAVQAFYRSLQRGPVNIVLVEGATPLQPPDGTQPILPATVNGEAMMDLKLTGSVAPDATLVVYGQSAHYGYCSNSWIDSLVAALDQRDYPCQAISISLGAPESAFSTQTALAINFLFAIASCLGITVCVASGDYGAPGRETGAYRQNCAFPASSPFALACGGTELVLASSDEPDRPPVLKGEVVWNEMQAPYQKRATGGGISMLFPVVPEYQRTLSLPLPLNEGQRSGRGVPDVASNAAQASGYALGPDHKGAAFGTSAAAPMWAALIALLVEGNGGRPIGFLHPLIYELQLRGGTCCTPIMEGENGPPGQGPESKIFFTAGAPWNACCGLGSPRGSDIAKALGIGD